jgi:hypothetical protein
MPAAKTKPAAPPTTKKPPTVDEIVAALKMSLTCLDDEMERARDLLLPPGEGPFRDPHHRDLAMFVHDAIAADQKSLYQIAAQAVRTALAGE